MQQLEYYLKLSKYDIEKANFLIEGFRSGFDLSYAGSYFRQDSSENIPIRVGSRLDMWNKIMKEVKLHRMAGPFDVIPYKFYVQSPIGLVPKANIKTRLIFHLSYDFGTPETKSINYFTPEHLCSVKYQDLDYAVATCINLSRRIGQLEEVTNCRETGTLFFAKSDIMSAFRILPVLPKQRPLLILKAWHPITNQEFFFVDKVLPFGSRKSCFLFQAFSNGLHHILEFVTARRFTVTNYLDDFLFVAEDETTCNQMVRSFLVICEQIGCPVSLEKTEWASQLIQFLGITINGRTFTLSIPEEKRLKAVNLINWILAKKTVTVKLIQRLTGVLNFLNRAIVPGRTFTRSMYNKLKIRDQAGNLLKGYHHVKVDQEFRRDASMWLEFLKLANRQVSQLCRPFVDLHLYSFARDLNFFTDASLNSQFGIGGIFGNRWIVQKWNPGFISKCNPSIEFLELYSLVAAVLTWSELITNCCIVIFCDNDAVKFMVNKMTSPCPKCMKLIRLLAFDGILQNHRLFVKFVSSKDNFLADSLSRMKFAKFWRDAPKTMNSRPDKIPEHISPVETVWFD